MPAMWTALSGPDPPSTLLFQPMPAACLPSAKGGATVTKRLHRRSQGTGEIRKMGNVWKIRYQLNGRRVQESSGSTRRADAVRLLNLRLGQIAEGRLHADAAGFRWADLERIILDEHKLHRSYEKVERHTRRHLHRCLHNCRVQTIDYARLLRYKNDRLAEGASPSTVRYELSLIRTGLVVAHKAGLVDSVPPLPSLKVENVKTGFFEPEDYAALLAHLPERVKPVVSFLFYSGWRRNEVLSRQWRHVDFDAGVIQLDPGETKSGKGRTLPFAALPPLRDLLGAQWEYTKAVELRTGQVVPWIFHREGKPIISIRQAWRTACKKAGLIGKIPHDFRRTAIRNLVRAGVPEKVAMALSGHETRSVFDRYNITSGDDLHEAIERLAAFHQTRTAKSKGHLRYPQGPKTTKTPRNSEGFAMEARGIEPRSEPRSEAALRA